MQIKLIVGCSTEVIIAIKRQDTIQRFRNIECN